MCLRSAQDPDSTLTLFIIYFPFFFSFSSAAQDFSLYLSLSSQHRVTSSWQTWCVCACVDILCVLARARDCREGWVILMSAGRVVISEPQAGQQEAAKQLVIWCGLRYCSMGVKLCVCLCLCVSEWETCGATSEITWTSHLCTESTGSYGSHSRVDAKINKS